MNIPRIASVEVAVAVYQENPLLFNEDIKTLFPGISNGTVVKLKKLANEVTTERGGVIINNKAVNTEDAYTAWGLDIVSLEKRYSKIMKRSASV